MNVIGPTSIATAVAHQMRIHLFQGSFEPGEVLKDTALAEQFGVARGTVRAAIQQLEAEGLLVRLPGHSARVPEFEALDIVDLYRVRLPIEWAAVESVVRRNLDLDLVQTAFEEMEKARSQDRAQLVSADLAFHRALVVSSGSTRLLQFFDQISGETQLMMAMLQTHYDHVDDLIEEHRELLEQLKRGNLKSCRAAWNEHFHSALVALNAIPDGGDDGLFF